MHCMTSKHIYLHLAVSQESKTSFSSAQSFFDRTKFIFTIMSCFHDLMILNSYVGRSTLYIFYWIVYTITDCASTG